MDDEAKRRCCSHYANKHSNNMKSLIFIVAATAVMADLVLGQDAYICDQPSTGCRFGIFSQEKCACECILPFCPDASGQCTATGGCANPWEDCERGVNCPWWVNSANAQSCTTGPVVRNTSVSVVGVLRCCSLFPNMQLTLFLSSGSSRAMGYL